MLNGKSYFFNPIGLGKTPSYVTVLTPIPTAFVGDSITGPNRRPITKISLIASTGLLSLILIVSDNASGIKDNGLLLYVKLYDILPSVGLKPSVTETGMGLIVLVNVLGNSLFPCH